MASTDYNSVGAGKTPKLGGSGGRWNKPAPGGSQKAPSAGTDIPKVGRPGGSEAKPKGSGMAPKVAKPGAPQGVKR